MQIDWITLAAQIANFLVLVWLLQRFLFRPITQAMKRREVEIEDRRTQANAARRQAEEEAETLRTKQAELEDKKEQVLDRARQDAQALRERLEADLREDMESRRETWRNHLADERETFAVALRRRAGHQVIAITGQMLNEYARTDVADAIASGFVARLRDLDDGSREKLVKATGTLGPAIVESNVALTPDARGQITHVLHDLLKADIDVQYRLDEDLVLGVRLTIGEQTLEWSAARHLKRLDSALDEAIDSVSPHATPHELRTAGEHGPV